jgi:hypothetical protein
MSTQDEPLTEPPAEPEGDDSEAGGGTTVKPIDEGELADTRPLGDEELERDRQLEDDDDADR